MADTPTTQPKNTVAVPRTGTVATVGRCKWCGAEITARVEQVRPGTIRLVSWTHEHGRDCATTTGGQ